MAELLDRWMDHIAAQGRAPTTMARYRSAIFANIKPRLGDMPITKVGPAELDGLYGQLARTGLTPLSIRKSHAILSAAFNQAVRWGWVDVNPVLRASPPSIRGREVHPPTQAELRRLLEQCATDHEDLGSLIFAAATTGPRRGELCGLRWSDLDLESGAARNTTWPGMSAYLTVRTTGRADMVRQTRPTVLPASSRDTLLRAEALQAVCAAHGRTVIAAPACS